MFAPSHCYLHEELTQVLRQYRRKHLSHRPLVVAVATKV